MKIARLHEWLGVALGTAAVLSMLLAWRPVPAGADLRELTGAQMADITGAGFSSFVIDGNTVRADFNIVAQTYTEIASLKMGYWDNGGGSGWDQDWTSVCLGDSSQDMVLSGFFLEATFDNLSDPVNRKLTGVYFGFRQVSGDLAAEFNSLSKISVDSDADYQRANLGLQTFRFNDSELSISFQLDGDYRGIWVRFGEGTTLQ